MALAIERNDFEELERLVLTATAPDIEQLLVNWLSEVLYHVDAKGWVFTKCVIEECPHTRIAAQAWGQRLSPSDRTRAVAVKAISYHQLSVKESPKGFEATVYVDIQR